jgi:tRNA modification GTPase
MTLAGAGGETIFALASGAGRAAVAVLRLSGPGSGPAVLALAGRLPLPRRASLRRLRHPATAELLDEALILWFPGPASYTGEDAAELHLHGGPAVLAAVAETLVGIGCRPAEPGEFTRRAFLAGRLDLTAAEGIADLIEAETTAQRRQALRQAGGALAALQRGWTTRLTRLLARQEAYLEFEEEGVGPEVEAAVATDAAALRAEMAAQLADGQRGERLRDGLSIAILGAPNVGKSSLLNALLGRQAAIVAAEAGTTRDVVEGRLVLAGVPVTLADTAGLREGGGAVEREGMRRARARGAEADLRLVVFAADAPPEAESLALLGLTGQGITLVVLNKCDLAQGPRPAQVPPEALAVSALTGAGLAALRTRLETAAAGLAGLSAEAGLTRPRHRAAVAEAIGWLDCLAEASLPELRAEALRGALAALGRLTGRVGVDQVLDLVFSEFCIGK